MNTFHPPKKILVIATVLLLGIVVLTAWGLKKVATNPGAPPNLLVSLVPASADSGTASTTPDVPVMQSYFEVVDSCNWDYEGACVNMRAGPGTQYPVVLRLRSGMVLQIGDTVVENGVSWYKVKLEPGVRYPERVSSSWYVAADTVQEFSDPGELNLLPKTKVVTTKRIVVNLTAQTLTAFEGDTPFMEEAISTGLDGTPTAPGTFTVYRKTPSRYMQGPIPGVSDQAYDLPGVPWDLYFTYGGSVIHGAYWHDMFGQPWSHGCVNLPSQKAKQLYEWATVGTPVIVEN